MMNKRMDLAVVEPDGLKAMLGLEKYIATTDLTKQHYELIKIRASQINGCAYCLDMHNKDARKYGETEQRLYTLSAWRDTPFFTKEEQALLALTEEVTNIKDHVADETYDNAVSLLGEKYTGQIIMACIIINGWNRFAIATGKMPE